MSKPVIAAAWSGFGEFAGFSYFSRGDHYVRYQWATKQVDLRAPLTAFKVPAEFASGFDAALDGQGAFRGKTYFFKGNRFVSYDWARQDMEPGFPAPLSRWNLPAGFAEGIDAAFNGIGRFAGKAYFFKGDRYVRYDWTTGKIDDGFPASISAWNLPAEFSQGIDAALNGQGQFAGEAYFFRGERYVRYNWGTGLQDQPVLPIAGNWGGVAEGLAPAAQPTARKRKRIWYVTIDNEDRSLDPVLWAGHKPNFDQLVKTAQEWDPVVVVEPIWMPALVPALLEDDSLLALFLAGSFTEWIEARNSPWREQLDTLCELIRTTRVPILAVCGSHQLTAVAFSGWGALAHMADQAGQRQPISAELADGIGRIPNPRSGEVGAFPMRRAAEAGADPLLAGISDPAYFIPWHHDEVLSFAVSGRFRPLLVPALDMEPLQVPAEGAEHRPIQDPSQRCVVQALAYKGEERVFYTVQFHPELTGEIVKGKLSWLDQLSPRLNEATENGRKLLQNFLSIAQRFWDQNP